MHRAFTKPANDAPFQSFPQENPRKTELDPFQPPISVLSTSTLQYIVVLYLIRTTWGGTFNLTAAPGAEPVAPATPRRESFNVRCWSQVSSVVPELSSQRAS